MLANTATAIIAPSSVYFSVANLVYTGESFLFHFEQSTMARADYPIESER
jgi:hypothetical protein